MGCITLLHSSLLGIFFTCSSFPCAGLTGCVYGFEEDGRSSAENQYTGGVNVVNCEGTICRFSLCSNGASCVLDQADVKGYTCNCTEVGWHGNFFESVVHVTRCHYT